MVDTPPDPSSEIEARQGKASVGASSPRGELDTLLETIPVGVFIMDGSGAVVRSNARATEIWGGLPPAASSIDDYALYKGWDTETGRPLAPEDWAGARAIRGETIAGEMVDIQRFDGRRATILNTAAPILDESGAVVGAVAAMLDMTDRRLRDEQIQHQLETAHLLLDALGALAGSLRLHEVLGRLVRIVRVIGNRPRASVFLWDEEASVLELAASSGEPRVDLGERLDLDRTSPYMRRAVTTKEATLADFGSLPSDQRGVAGTYLVASVIVPLVWDERLLGVLTVDETAQDKPFEPRETELIEGISAQAAVAVENARLYESQRGLAEQSQTLAQISIALSTQDFDRAVPLVLQRSCGFLASSGAILARKVPGGWATTHAYGERIGNVAPFYSDAESAARTRMAATLDPQLVSDVLADPDIDPDIARSLGYRSYISLPLQLQERVVGALTFFFDKQQQGFAPDIWTFFERLEYIVAASMESRRLFGELNRRADYAAALNNINEAVHSTLRFDEIMGRVVVETARAGGVDATAVHMYEDGRWRFTHTYGLPHELSAARLSQDQAPMSMTVMKERRVLVVPSIDAEERFAASIAKAFNVRAVIGVPLFSRDQVIGVMFSGCFSGPQHFDQDQVDFLVKVGSTVSLAIENARLYESEHRIAETLQQALLALPDRVPGVRFAYAYRSASEAAYVGGDFYDVFELGQELVGILVGDIAGKGLEAAVLTSLLKNTIRAHAAERPHSPDTALSLTNDIVLKVTPAESFATVFFAVLDLRTGELIYTNAGHPTAFIRRAAGGISELPSNSPLIGALDDPHFAQEVTTLRTGDVLLVYTDGVTEARSGRLFYGQDRVAHVLEHAQGQDPASVVRSLVDDIMAFTGNRLSDDLAILAVECDKNGAAETTRSVAVPTDGTA